MSETPDDTRELIRHLCTQAGMIMEDASAEAILWDGDREALDALANQIAKAQTLIAAARLSLTNVEGHLSDPVERKNAAS